MALAAAGATTAMAANSPLVSPNATPWIGVRAKALGNMTSLTCGSVACTAATSEELAHPPVSDAEAQIAYQRGIYTGAAEHCGLDGQSRNYAPMMAWWQTTRRMKVRQIALVAAIHDMAKGLAKTAMGRIGACSPETRADIDKRLDFRPPASQ
jgi:hypothetical protein